MTINPVTEADFDEWLQLALELWPEPDDSDVDDMASTLHAIAQSPREAAFLVRNELNEAIGFMNLSLRSDYVPGATQKPVAYVEGIYVRPAFHHQGIGRQLMERAEAWARENGCHELASDALIDNVASAEFHTKVGFTEVERTVFFIKEIPH